MPEHCRHLLVGYCGKQLVHAVAADEANTVTDRMADRREPMFGRGDSTYSRTARSGDQDDPTWDRASSNANSLPGPDPRKAYGQRPRESHSKVEHMAAPATAATCSRSFTTRSHPHKARCAPRCRAGSSAICIRGRDRTTAIAMPVRQQWVSAPVTRRPLSGKVIIQHRTDGQVSAAECRGSLSRRS